MYTATYEITPAEHSGAPMTCEVGGYPSIEALKAETSEVILKTLQEHKQPFGLSYIVNATITDETGEYVDSDEFEVSTKAVLVVEGCEILAAKPTNPLLDFIKQEVPFRLEEILGVDPEDITGELVGEIVAELYENSDILFDYDSMDGRIRELLDESGVPYDG